MNEIVNNILVAGDKFILKMHLGQPGFTYSAYGKNKKIKKKQQEIHDIFIWGTIHCLWRF